MMSLTRDQLERLAHEAGRLALRHFRRVPAERKADRSLVTLADREIEHLLVTELASRLPEADIIGEEGARRIGRGSLLVAIDPIDGTAAFVAGLPTWCICIGILQDGEPIAGVVHLPCTGETFSAADGMAHWNGVPLSRLNRDEPSGDRFIVADGNMHRRYHVAYPGKIRSLGSAAHHVALVARGAAEAAFLGQARLWDLAGPGAVLLAVGGSYEYLSGKPVDLRALTNGTRAPEAVLAGLPITLAALRTHIVARP